MKIRIKNGNKRKRHTFFRYCLICGKRFQPSGRAQKKCYPCIAKKARICLKARLMKQQKLNYYKFPLSVTHRVQYEEWKKSKTNRR